MSAASHPTPELDPWRDEMMRSLFAGTAIPGRRQRLAAIQRAEQEQHGSKITLPRGYEPAYLR